MLVVAYCFIDGEVETGRIKGRDIVAWYCSLCLCLCGLYFRFFFRVDIGCNDEGLETCLRFLRPSSYAIVFFLILDELEFSVHESQIFLLLGQQYVRRLELVLPFLDLCWQKRGRNRNDAFK